MILYIFEIVIVVVLFFILGIITLIMIGNLMNMIPKKRTPVDVADEIDYLVETAEGRNDEDYSDAIDMAFNRKIRDPKLESIRQECLHLRRMYPPEHPLGFCGRDGLVRLKELSKELREM